MSKKLIFILVAFLSLVLVGCTEPGGQGGGGTDPEVPPVISEDEFNVAFETISNDFKENIPYLVSNDLDLKTEYSEFDATIEWTSSNEDLISFTGLTNIPKNSGGEVTLTYLVTIDDKSKEGSINVIAIPCSINEIADKFAKQFSDYITRDYDNLTISYYDLFEIDWTSSNTDILSDDGIFIKPELDTDFEIKFVVKCGEYISEEFKKEVCALGMSDLDKLNYTLDFINNECLFDLYLTQDQLPSKYERLNATLEWVSSNPDVISKDGKITHYVYERYVSLTCNYKLPNGSAGSVEYECIVSPLDITQMTEEQILENFLSTIAVSTIDQVSFGYTECPGLSKTYHFLYFYVNEETKIHDYIIPKGTSNRSGTEMDAQLVVVHDTGNPNGSAKGNAQYVKSGYSGSTTSWHYTTGVDGVYQTLPENECGAHANGSQSDKFKLVDTKIKATAKKPKVELRSDNYIYINGEKTKISNPSRGAKLADDGLLVEIGENGNYYIPKMWFCEKYSSAATQGGNGSGIGIESAAQTSVDYNVTLRKTSKLVAEILIRQELGISRVVQHNTTSGKNCPQAIREANYWYNFKDYVSMEKFAKENLSEYNFTWNSTSEMMDNEGYINIKVTKGTILNYSVVVTKNETAVLNKSYSTEVI